MKKFNLANLIILPIFILVFSVVANFSAIAYADSIKTCAKSDQVTKKLADFQTNIAKQDKEKNNIVAQLQKLESKETGAKKNQANELLTEIASRTETISSLRTPVLNDYKTLEKDICTGKAKTVKVEQTALKKDIDNLNKQVTAFKNFVKIDLKKAIKKL